MEEHEVGEEELWEEADADGRADLCGGKRGGYPDVRSRCGRGGSGRRRELGEEADRRGGDLEVMKGGVGRIARPSLVEARCVVT